MPDPWNPGYQFGSWWGGAESLDADCDGFLLGDGHPGNAGLPAGWSYDTVTKYTGAASYKVVADGSQGKLFLDSGIAALSILARYFICRFDGSPSINCDFIKGTAGATQLELELTTDRKFRFVRASDGAAISSLTSAVPVDTWARVYPIVDPRTLNASSKTRLMIFMDTGSGWVKEFEEEVSGIYAFDSHEIGNWGNLGINVWLDDLVPMAGHTDAIAPHLLTWPVPKVVASHPKGDISGRSDWTRVPNTGELYYQDWDDATGDDGDTTYLWTSGGYPKEMWSDGQTAADLGLAADAVVLHQSNTFNDRFGPASNLVHKTSLPAGSKNAMKLHHLNGANPLQGMVGTSWVGYTNLYQRASGVWLRSDIGGELGFLTDNLHNWIYNVTMLMFQYVVSEEELPLADGPAEGITETAVDRVGAATFMGLSVGVT